MKQLAVWILCSNIKIFYCLRSSLCVCLSPLLFVLFFIESVNTEDDEGQMWKIYFTSEIENRILTLNSELHFSFDSFISSNASTVKEDTDVCGTETFGKDIKNDDDGKHHYHSRRHSRHHSSYSFKAADLNCFVLIFLLNISDWVFILRF